MDLWNGPLRPLHRFHSISHGVMEEEPLKDSGAVFSHVRQNGHLFLHCCILRAMVKSP